MASTFSSLKVAHDAGHLLASTLQPGDTFLGAIPEANLAGYERGSFEEAFFVQGYLSALIGKRITTGNDNVIIAINNVDGH